MKKLNLIHCLFTKAIGLTVVLLFFFNPAMPNPGDSHLLPVIPAPQNWQPSTGSFPKQNLQYLIQNPDDPLKELSTLLARQLNLKLKDEATTGCLKLVFEAPDRPPSAAEEIIEPGAVDEGYRLEIRNKSLILSAKSRSGLFRGAQTLRQLMQAAGDDLPCGVIDDYPEFSWRGMLLDCGRHFMPVELIKSTIDQLAYHKFNVFHWHLTEDQGWRLEVPGYDRLTEVAAWRDEWDGTRYGGYYTSEQVREVVAYAARRFITVVPEIEMPGHSVAALAAYPDLSCQSLPLKVETQWGVFRDVYCAGNDETFTFLEDVLSHALELFPSRYIHIGGDESPKQRWKVCAKCQQRISEEGLADEHELQSWFIRRIETFLLDHERRLIGWDEILEGGLAPAATVQSWRGVQGAIAAAEQGHDAIVSPTTHCYFDGDVSRLDLRKVHSFRPRPPSLNETEQNHILGGEMNLWTEYIPPERLNKMLFPRLMAMAECLWTAPEPRDFSAFWDRLRPHLELLKKAGINPGPSDRPIQSMVNHHLKNMTTTISLSIDSDLEEAMKGRILELRYRGFKRSEIHNFRPDLRVEDMGLPAILMSDNPVPSHGPLDWPQTEASTEILLIQLFIDGWAYGTPEVIERSKHLAQGIIPAQVHGPSSRYPGGGPSGLCNGLHGGINFRDGQWSGYEGNNLDATIDLERITNLTQLSIRFYQGSTAWVFLPLDVEFLISDDAQNWQSLSTLTHDLPLQTQDRTIHNFILQDLTVAARYVRIIGRNLSLCPDWHPGAGRPCWIFADEIVIQ